MYGFLVAVIIVCGMISLVFPPGWFVVGFAALGLLLVRESEQAAEQIENGNIGVRAGGCLLSVALLILLGGLTFVGLLASDGRLP